MANDPKPVPLRDLRMSMTFRGNRVADVNFLKDVNQSRIEDVGKMSKKSRIYTLNDYKWTDSYGSGVNYEENPMPKLIITEFQPEKSVPWGKLIDNLSKWTAGLTNILGGAGATGMGLVAAATQDALIEKYTANTTVNSQLLRSDNISMQFVQNLLKGQYLSSYELPFFDNTYIQANTTANWSSGGSEAMMGQEMSRVMQETSNVNFPMTPTWSKTGDDGFDIQSEFHLINSDTDALKRNFGFLHAFAAGAFWVQVGLVQFPPNLYDVYCPGRFHKYWCAMGITVTYEGKQRQNIGLVDYMRSAYSLNGMTRDFTFPEAYKVTVSFKDLTPNNYNVWAENLKYGPFGNGQIIEDNKYNPGLLIGNRTNQTGLGAVASEALAETYNGIKQGVEDAMIQLKEQF